MKLKMDNLELIHLIEKIQKLLLKPRVIIALGCIDLVKELSCKFQIIVEQKHLLYNK